MNAHNDMTKEWVTKVAHHAGTSAELLVILESTILGSMLILDRVHGLSPATCVGMIEVALHRATERFVAEREQ